MSYLTLAGGFPLCYSTVKERRDLPSLDHPTICVKAVGGSAFARPAVTRRPCCTVHSRTIVFDSTCPRTVLGRTYIMIQATLILALAFGAAIGAPKGGDGQKDGQFAQIQEQVSRLYPSGIRTR